MGLYHETYVIESHILKLIEPTSGFYYDYIEVYLKKIKKNAVEF
jgi:hypothetical protein